MILRRVDRLQSGMTVRINFSNPEAPLNWNIVERIDRHPESELMSVYFHGRASAVNLFPDDMVQIIL